MALAAQADFARESVKGALWKPKPQQEPSQDMAAAAQVSASETTGIEWEGKGDKIKVRGPDIEDVAVLSTTHSLEEPSAESSRISLLGIKVSRQKVQEEIKKYREAKRGSKSHNLMHERFMAWGKTSVQLVKLIAMGVSPQEIAQIDAQVREQAVAEIDDRIRTDYSYAKATLDIFG